MLEIVVAWFENFASRRRYFFCMRLTVCKCFFLSALLRKGSLNAAAVLYACVSSLALRKIFRTPTYVFRLRPDRRTARCRAAKQK